MSLARDSGDMQGLINLKPVVADPLVPILEDCIAEMRRQ